MESIIVYPKNKKQKSLVKSLLEEMNIYFELNEKEDNTLLSEVEFYQKIEKSIEQAESGQIKIISKEKQKEMLGL
jgi:hypothetical protein